MRYDQNRRFQDDNCLWPSINSSPVGVSMGSSKNSTFLPCSFTVKMRTKIKTINEGWQHITLFLLRASWRTWFGSVSQICSLTCMEPHKMVCPWRSRSDTCSLLMLLSDRMKHMGLNWAAKDLWTRHICPLPGVESTEGPGLYQQTNYHDRKQAQQEQRKVVLSVGTFCYVILPG